MKQLLIIPLALLVLVFTAQAEEGTAGTPPKPPQGEMPAQGSGPKPPLPPKPGSERAELFRENQQERKELFQENAGERKEFRQEFASSTRPNIGERKFNTMEGKEGMPRPFGSTTREDLMERRQMFASTTMNNLMERKELFMGNLEERRMHFASTTAERREGFKENMMERKEHFASTTALRKAEFTEEMKTRILAHADQAAELMDAMLGRLAGIAERIAGRIDELSADGVDTTDAEAALDDAYDAIAAAEVAVNDAKEEIAATLESEEPRDLMEGAKAAGEAAKMALRAAHEALRTAAELLPKPPKPAEEPTI